ncbi:hypothetical protein CVT25_007484 [Psilocybe cyanescens]|uniref:Uncharacterized protein n=1 Tax=Psilocybe cyanescens TaxID=93625 RepID=A0A409XVR1_PSICY|nr:hypothetical protein CVT25_007484 [Psilocybe cyanescens]
MNCSAAYYQAFTHNYSSTEFEGDTFSLSSWMSDKQGEAYVGVAGHARTLGVERRSSHHMGAVQGGTASPHAYPIRKSSANPTYIFPATSNLSSPSRPSRQLTIHNIGVRSFYSPASQASAAA